MRSQLKLIACAVLVMMLTGVTAVFPSFDVTVELSVGSNSDSTGGNDPLATYSASNARFNFVQRVCPTWNGQQWLAPDYFNKAIRIVNPQTGSTSTLGPRRSFNPLFIALGEQSTNTAYFITRYSNSVQKLDVSSGATNTHIPAPGNYPRGLVRRFNPVANRWELLVTFAHPGSMVRSYVEATGAYTGWQIDHALFQDLRGICLSPDGALLAVADSDGNRVWVMDIASKTFIREISMVKPYDVSWSPNGHWLTVAVRTARILQFISTVDWSIVSLTNPSSLGLPSGAGGVESLGNGQLVVSLNSLRLLNVPALLMCLASGIDSLLLDAALPLRLAQMPQVNGSLVSNGTVLVFDDCISGYTSTGNVTVECVAGQWTTTDHDFRCQDTSMASMISQLSQTLLAVAAAVQSQGVDVEQLRANLTQTEFDVGVLQNNVIDICVDALQGICMDALQDDIDDNADAIAALRPNITQAQVDIGQLASQTAANFTAAESDLASTQADVVVLQGNASTSAAAIKQHANDAEQLRVDLTQVQADVTAVDGDLASTQANVVVLQGNASTTAVALAQHTADIAQSQSDVDVLEAYAAISADAVGALQQDMTQAQEAIDATQEDIADNVKTGIAANADNITLASVDIDELRLQTQDNFTAAESDLASTQADVGILQGNVSTSAAAIAQNAHNAEQAQADLDVFASQTTDSFATVQGDIAATQADVTILQANASTSASKLEQHQASIVQNHDDITVNVDNITQAQVDIGALRLQTQDNFAAVQGDVDTLQANATTSANAINELRGNLIKTKTEVAQEISQVDIKANEAKTSGARNAQTVADVQDEAATDNQGAVAIGVVALLIGFAVVTAAGIFVWRAKNKTKNHNQNNASAGQQNAAAGTAVQLHASA